MNAEATKINDRRAMTVLAEQSAVSTPVTPMEMLAIAVKQGADLEKMRMLMDLKREWEADEARRQFNEAFAAFKADAIVIVKGTTIKEGPLKGKKHADLFDVVGAVTPKLSAHGLSIAWKLTKDEPAWMEVTCTLRHAAGHSESVSMGGGPDTGPGRNAIQARGSTKTYLERYTVTAILGLAAQDADDDGGKASGVEYINETQAADLKALMTEVAADSAKFLAYMKADSLADIPAKDYTKAVRALEAKRKQ